jgi:hypothetical protein
MVELMRWALTDGQRLAPELELAALATIRVSQQHILLQERLP